MKKCLPRGSAFVYQLFLLMISPVIFVSLIFLEQPAIIWFTIIFGTIWMITLVLLILSLTIWWNVPLVINSNGISHKQKCCLWSDFSKLNSKGYGGAYGIFYRFIITYSDGSTIVFQPSRIIIKAMLCFCNDKRFLETFKCFLEQEGYFLEDFLKNH